MIAIRNTRDDATPPTILLYGPPGAGKTTFAASFPRPLVLDFDQGLRSVGSSGIDYIACRGLRMTDDTLRTIADRCAPYDTIVLDSLTEFVRQTLEGGPAEAVERSGPTLVAWGRTNRIIGAVVRRLQRCGKTLVLTSLSREGRDETSAAFVRPGLPRRLGVEMAALSDLVLYIAPERDEAAGLSIPVVTTKDTGRIYAKDRTGTLPVRMRATLGQLRAAGLLPSLPAETPLVAHAA